MIKKHNLFHLDDDPEQRTLLETICKNITEVNYFEFTTAEEFLTSLKQQSPEICVIDLNLEEGIGAGFTVIQAIQNKLEDDIEIIVLSRRSDIKDTSKALDLGVDDYIIKPIDFELFADKIKTLIHENTPSEFPQKKLKKPLSAKLELMLTPFKADESYLYFKSKNHFLKNSKIQIRHPLIKEIFGNDSDDFRVHDCSLDESEGDYILKLAKWSGDDQFFDSLRNYILEAN
jgi:DNA-binding response OmpR family regulator